MIAGSLWKKCGNHAPLQVQKFMKGPEVLESVLSSAFFLLRVFAQSRVSAPTECKKCVQPTRALADLTTEV